jgi:hypothetical protein
MKYIILFVVVILMLGTVGSTPQSDPVVVGAGDIARCSMSQDYLTADIIEGIPSATVITFGDNTQVSGTTQEFTDCYNPSWGTFRSRTQPSPGNHDYGTAEAAPYYAYFGVPEYYSYDIGAWHIVSLNSQIDIGANSPQVQWLNTDLSNHNTACSLVYFHRPRFTSGTSHPSDPTLGPIWDVLYAHGVDVVLNGHVHQYERFAKQNPQGIADSSGIREFVVGTGGGGSLVGYSLIPNSQVLNNQSYGVIELTLHPNGYDWAFVPAAGYTFTDSGNDTCSIPTGVPSCWPMPGGVICRNFFIPIVTRR